MVYTHGALVTIIVSSSNSSIVIIIIISVVIIIVVPPNRVFECSDSVWGMICKQSKKVT